MHGMTPLFISCKNGRIDEREAELYKLSAVADRFGYGYAKKMLIATYFGKDPQNLDYFHQRAADMGIHLVGGAHTMDTDEELQREIHDCLFNKCKKVKKQY